MVRLREIAFETPADYADWRTRGRQIARQAMKRGEFLLWISGNHLGVLPIYEAFAAATEKTMVVQFDAHLDIHHFADCTSELSHGNFLLHCDGPLPPLVNVGHRDLLLTPDYIARYFRQTYSAMDLALNPEPVFEKLRQAAQSAQRVFVDIDCDVFDPVYFPAVAQPAPFGLSPPLVLRLLDAVWSPRVIGLSLSEFDPGRDQKDQSLATLVWLLEYLLLRHYEGPVSRENP
jgi:arginase family enzyme